jgi:hypothetical protein
MGESSFQENGGRQGWSDLSIIAEGYFGIMPVRALADTILPDDLGLRNRPRRASWLFVQTAEFLCNWAFLCKAKNIGY